MPTSKKSLRVLMIEDSEDDYELIRLKLVQGGFDLRSKRVETVPTILEALKNDVWEMVICDHNLPTLDSTTALKVVQQIAEDVPFVIVSGAIPDEVAIESMRRGAKDFIRKNNLSRLVPVVERELQEARLRTELRVVNESLYRANHYDHLTGLANREHLFRHLGCLLSATDGGCPFCILMLDLNRFRKITRSLGILAGNKVLIEVTRRLSEVFAEKNFVARYGADKFVIVVPNLNAEVQAENIVKSIHSCLDGVFKINGHELFVTASVGASFYPRDGRRPEYLMEKVEAAVFSAKVFGGCGYLAYKAEFDAHGKDRLDMESALHRAMRQNEFVLYYQPQFDLTSKRLIGAEALVRWMHPESGLISPSAFVPILEDTGLIIPVGEWILRTACAQNKHWQDAGLSPIRMAVNLSAIQFQQPDLIAKVKDALQDSCLSPEFLELEITENIAVNSAESVVALLNELRSLGIKLAIDDFGTGYSSLSYLKRFPIDKLKIDQSFIRNFKKGTADDEIVKAIISMGHNLKLKVIAEGVETQQQADFLIDNDCDEVQGYLYGKPMRASEFALLLNRVANSNRSTSEATV